MIIKSDLMKVGSYIFILISLLSCQKNVHDFERSKIVINDQQIEILTAFDIFENYLTKKSTNWHLILKPL